MKLFHILSHPYTLITCFSFMIISGQSMGGFFIMYILLGLLHGVLHSLLGFYGILLLVIGHHLSLKRNVFIKQGIKLAGLSLMFASVFFFFSNDSAHYNWPTFSQGLPMFTLVFTAFIAVCFLLGIFGMPQPKGSAKHGMVGNL